MIAQKEKGRMNGEIDYGRGKGDKYLELRQGRNKITTVEPTNILISIRPIIFSLP